MIDEGRCIFFGPRQRARQYFEELGFYCSPRQTTADFLTAITDPYARRIAEGSEAKAPRTSQDLEAGFKHSADGESNLSAIGKFEEEIKSRQASPTGAHRRSVYTLPLRKQVSICATRQFQVLWGDKFTFFAKFGLTIFQSLVFGSLFYNQPATSSGVFTRGGVIL